MIDLLFLAAHPVRHMMNNQNASQMLRDHGRLHHETPIDGQIPLGGHIILWKSPRFHLPCECGHGRMKLVFTTSLASQERAAEGTLSSNANYSDMH